jgi:hypothetical protein
MSPGGKYVLQKKLLATNGDMATQQFLREKMAHFCRRCNRRIWTRWPSPFKKLKRKGLGEASLKYGDPSYLPCQGRAFYRR